MSKNASFRQAARRGGEWLAEQVHDRGMGSPPQGPQVYYKSLYALSIVGRQDEALSLLSWTAGNALSKHGIVRIGNPEGMGVYRYSWLLQGAWRTGRIGLALRWRDFIRRCQAPCGGFFLQPREESVVEAAWSGWGGMGTLCSGDVEIARRAGDALCGLFGSQSEPERLYTTMTPDGEPILGSGGSFVDATQPGQTYWRAGIPFLFLMRLYEATEEDRYLQTAWGIFRFLQRASDDAFSHLTAGKSMLAAALLWSVTGDQKARDAAVRQGEYFLSIQSQEGYWTSPARDDVVHRIDHTAEFVIFMAESAAILRDSDSK